MKVYKLSRGRAQSPSWVSRAKPDKLE